jgi:hypothetical protein
MKRVWGQLLLGLSLLAGAAAAVPACTHNNSTLFVQDVLAPPQVSQGGVCTYTADPTQPSIASGRLDVALRQHYDAFFLLANQMVAESNSQQLQTETSTITIQGAVVRITDVAGNQVNTFTVSAATTVYPASGSVPGYASIGPVTIIDTQSVANAGGQLSSTQQSVRLITHTKFFGNTLGGRYVESGEFDFPVDICETTPASPNCLVAFSQADINPLFTTPNCMAAAAAAGGSSSTSSLPVPCVFGQDDVVDCSACLSNPACNPKAQPIAGIVDAGGGG